MSVSDKKELLYRLFYLLKKNDLLKDKIMFYLQKIRFYDEKRIVIHFVFEEETKYNINVIYITIGSNNNFIVYFDRPGIFFDCNDFNILVNRILELYKYPFFPNNNNVEFINGIKRPNRNIFNSNFGKPDKNLGSNSDSRRPLKSFFGETSINLEVNPPFGIPFGTQRKDLDTSNLQPFFGFGTSSFSTPGFVDTGSNQSSPSVESNNAVSIFSGLKNDVFKTPVKNNMFESLDSEDDFVKKSELQNILGKRYLKSEEITPKTRKTRKSTK
jgi:hypothetical protein